MPYPGSIAILEVTAEVVSAFLAKNHPSPRDLPALIASVHVAFDTLATSKRPAGPAARLVPPVPIETSVTDEYLISLEDGKRYRWLKRHLTARGLTPDAYRAKWGLPPDYPMIASIYANRLSGLAKKSGLGFRSRAMS